MSKLIPGNHKHLTLKERLYIEHSLNEGSSLKDIARFLCKDPT
ncbi:helix-turn-helix domain-containing protein, partial [Enterocloster bolteae]